MAGRPGTRLAALIGAATLFAPISGAAAMSDTVSLSSRLAMAAPPTATSPANTGFGWTHHLATDPPGSQPDRVTSFTVAVPQPFVLNARDFPACGQSEIDGVATVPADCRDALVGAGTVTMYAGSPGSPLANSVREDMTARIYNGTPAGDTVLLVVSSVPSAPVGITNRVIPGAVGPEPGDAFGIRFAIPADLQNQLGLTLTFTDIDVTISGTPRSITVGGITSAMSYLQLPSCPDQMSTRQLADFMGSTGAITTVEAAAPVQCAIGTFPDPPDLPTSSFTSPRIVPAYADPLPEQARVPLLTVPPAAALGRVKPRRDGRFALPKVIAFCPPGAAGACPLTGSARAGHATVATLWARVASGAHASPIMKLTASGRRLLARTHVLPVTASLKLTTPAGATATKVVGLKLVRPSGRQLPR